MLSFGRTDAFPQRTVNNTARRAPNKDGIRYGQMGRWSVGPNMAAARRLHPIDADGFLVARLILEADADEILALQHLPTCLSKSCFISIHRRKSGDSGSIERQTHQYQQWPTKHPPPIHPCCKHLNRSSLSHIRNPLRPQACSVKPSANIPPCRLSTAESGRFPCFPPAIASA